MFSIVKPPYLLRRYYKNFTWKIPTDDNTLYLTFDDGPIPHVTSFVLDCLQEFNAKATFFCLGKNVQQHPEIYQQIISQGHRTGNHTYSHLNGWQASTKEYIHDVKITNELVQTNLFRPPYGRIKKEQSDEILKTHQIIMWDVLSYDFNTKITPVKCYENVIRNVRPGSVIVFHDSAKAFKNLEYTLPRCLEYFKLKNYTTALIP